MSQKSKKWIPIAVALVLVGGLCIFAGYKAVTAIMNDVSAAGANVDPNAVAISMSAGDVMLPEAQTYYEDTLQQYSYYGYDLSDEVFLDQLKTSALESLAFERIAQIKIEEMGLDTLTDEDLAQCRQQAQEEYDYTLADMLASYSDESKTEEENMAFMLDYFESANFTVETLTDYYKETLIYNRLAEALTADVTVSDEQVEADFQEAVAADQVTYENDVASYELMTQLYGEPVYYVPAGYRGVKHILLTTPDDLKAQLDALNDERYALENELSTLQLSAETSATADPAATPDPAATAASMDAQIAAKQAEIDAKNAEIEALRQTIPDALSATIQEIQEKLAAGVAFDELIEAYGQDPGMTAEPAKSEGYAVHAQSTVYDEAFQKGAMSLENLGDVSGPVVSDFGVHILQYFRDVPGGAVELTDARREVLREALLASYKQDAYQVKVEEWFVEYNVTLHPELLQ